MGEWWYTCTPVNVAARYRWVVSCTPRLLKSRWQTPPPPPPGARWTQPTTGGRPPPPPCGRLIGPKNRSGRLEVKVLFPVPWIEPQFLGRPADGLVTVLSELSQLLYLCRRNNFMYCWYVERNRERQIRVLFVRNLRSLPSLWPATLAPEKHDNTHAVRIWYWLSSCHHPNQPDSFETLKNCALRRSTSLGPFTHSGARDPLLDCCTETFYRHV